MIWLNRGAAAGAILAGTEALFTVASGYNLSLTYLLAVAVLDLVAGVAGGLLAALFAWVLHRGMDTSFAGAFVPLGAATAFIYLLDKSVVTAAFRGWPATLGLAALAVAMFTLGAIMYPLARRIGGRGQSESSVLLGVFLVIVFLIGSRHLTRSVFGSYLTLGAMAANASLLSLLLVALATQCRLLGRGRVLLSLPAFPSAAAFAGVAFVGTVLAWRAGLPDGSLRPFAPKRPPALSRPNVVLISIDTLRADRLSTYGYERPTSPVLSELAAQGVLFRKAISPGNWTPPGHASLFTGMFPKTHGAFQMEYPALGPASLTLAEILSAAGYRTGAIVANSSSLSRPFGFDQGFAFYDDRPARSHGYQPVLNGFLTAFPLLQGWATKPFRTAEEVTVTTCEWLRQNADAPFFLFVNYMDPHYPYAPPPPHHARFGGGRAFLFPDPRWDILRGSRGPTHEESEHFRALYDGEVAYVDRSVGRLLEEITRIGVYERSLIVVTSDHGEFLGEHGLCGHGVGPYQPVHHVPLIVKYPGNGPVAVEENWVSLVDVMPTILETAGLPAQTPIQGQVLGRATHPVMIEGAPDPALTRYYGRRFEKSYKGVYEGAWKLVSYSDGAVELFNVRDDPGEVVNLASRHADRTREMNQRLEGYWNSLPRATFLREADSEVRDRLKAGGYVQ
jgi:arylsulfatase A-like enzyme/energy-converting hydrogenase Eha subunit B